MSRGSLILCVVATNEFLYVVYLYVHMCTWVVCYMGSMLYG